MRPKISNRINLNPPYDRKHHVYTLSIWKEVPGGSKRFQLRQDSAQVGRHPSSSPSDENLGDDPITIPRRWDNALIRDRGYNAASDPLVGRERLWGVFGPCLYGYLPLFLFLLLFLSLTLSQALFHSLTHSFSLLSFWLCLSHSVFLFLILYLSVYDFSLYSSVYLLVCFFLSSRSLVICLRFFSLPLFVLFTYLLVVCFLFLFFFLLSPFALRPNSSNFPSIWDRCIKHAWHFTFHFQIYVV